MIEIVRAPAHLVVQDLGFKGMRSTGLPRAGAMDPAALQAGNRLVGNRDDEAALEWAVSGGAIRFTKDVTIAITGAHAHGRVGSQLLTTGAAIRVSAGATLEIDRISSGRFLYLCISPAISIPQVFGSRSTYIPAGIGGFNGRRLRNGDELTLASHETGVSAAPFAAPDYSRDVIRIVRAPQSDVLDGKLLAFLCENRFTVSHASDRTGYRLDGPSAPVEGLKQILSEPACEGAIQITDAGTPIVLMADGPTIGGYNKVAVVAKYDLGILAQKPPGATVLFALRG
jgi:antagonist of KipI